MALNTEDSACLFWDLLRNIAGIEPKSVSGGSIQTITRPDAQKRSNKNEKIKCSAGNFLPGNHVCHRIFCASGVWR
jgi:hypothetical protein